MYPPWDDATQWFLSFIHIPWKISKNVSNMRGKTYRTLWMFWSVYGVSTRYVAYFTDVWITKVLKNWKKFSPYENLLQNTLFLKKNIWNNIDKKIVFWRLEGFNSDDIHCEDYGSMQVTQREPIVYKEMEQGMSQLRIINFSLHPEKRIWKQNFAED